MLVNPLFGKIQKEYILIDKNDVYGRSLAGLQMKLNTI